MKKEVEMVNPIDKKEKKALVTFSNSNYGEKVVKNITKKKKIKL